ncbi:MAG: hypothetical protein EBT13_16140 [Rhodobacteraceae bacterium]|nr:hypothetical protein [Paracoccaceae bacterium]
MNDIKTFPVLSIDAWTDGDDGWTWNNWYRAGTVDVDINAGTDAILHAMYDAGFITRTDGGDVDDDQYNLVIVDAETREPLFAIEYGAA